MENTEEQNTEPQFNLYLESPKAFYLEMPLYHSIDLGIEPIAKAALAYLFKFNKTVDAYCIWCNKESVFDIEEHASYSPSVFWIDRIVLRCSRNTNHRYFIYYLRNNNSLTKIGQWPSVADFQIPQAEKYRKILGEEAYKELTRGIGLAANGVGIGSFVYLRRIFENLIEEAHIKAKSKNEGFIDEKYLNAKMDAKIKMVEGYLPEFLVENRSLYAIMSKGIHSLSEDECFQYFETVKLGIEQILDEKIIQEEKAEKAAKARTAIQKAHGKIAN